MHSSYTNGLVAEEKVKQFLRSCGHAVDPSTKEENTRYDIDCFVDGEPVSIKVPHNSYNSHNIGLETWHFKDDWQPTGWFYTGKVRYYVVWHKTGDVVQYDKWLLKESLDIGIFKSLYKKQLREETCVNQKAIGHGTIDAESVYVDTKECIELGVAKVIGHMPCPGQKGYSLLPKKRNGSLR